MFSLLLGAVGLCGVSVADDAMWPDLSSSPRVGGGSQDAAVIIAIEDYAFVSDIPGAQSNGLDWYTYMTDGRGLSPGRVKLLENAQASKEEIALAVESARAQVGSDGTLWFVFIGHGAPSADGQDGLLLGVDVQQTATSVYARGLPQSDLMASLSVGPQSETVVVLDACFSGQTQSGALVAGLQPLIPTYATASDRTTILSAGRGNEFAGPLPGLGRPAFSYLALGAIRGWGDEDGDGAVSASEVASYTQGALSALPLGRTQTPQHSGPDGVLGQARETGPSLSQIRRALSGTSTARPQSGPLTVESSGGEGISAADIEALLMAQQAREAAEAEEAALLAKLRREREAALSAAVSAKQEEARALWTRMAPLLSGGGPEAQQAVAAFVSAWSGAEVVVEDVEGRHVRSVSAPEVATAESWLAAQQATSSRGGGGERSTGRSGYEMAWIEPGQFVMGSPSSEADRDDDETQHDVQISRGFYMGVYEVTQGLWADVMGSNPSTCDYQGVNLCDPSYPVQNVNWFDAVRFANALSERDGYTKCYEISGETVRWASGFDCNGYRLPTEAEWEYAARGGQAHVYSGSNTVGDVGWYNGNAGRMTHPVGGKSANGYGLYDMSGNVLEWCWDWKGTYPTGTTVDPVGPSTGSFRVRRGGSWIDRSTISRAANRSWLSPASAQSSCGLRLARSN